MQLFYKKRSRLLRRHFNTFCVLLFVLGLVAPQHLFAGTFTVNFNGDTHAANLVTGVDAGGKITLRSALEAANATAGSSTIQFSITGTITLTLGQITVGASAVGNNITVTGPGINQLTINQTTLNRVFITGTGAVTFTLTDLTLNYSGPGPTTGSITGGGGAILAGGAGAATTLSKVKISGFTVQRGNGGAISQSSSLASHNLTITDCIFQNNLCGGAGGAVSYNSKGGTCTITNSTFDHNMTGMVGLAPDINTGGSGGAVNTTGGDVGGTYIITRCTFLNNHSAAQGGAIANTNGMQSTDYCRFIGNTAAVATDGNVFWQAGGALLNSIVANNNWWGSNGGPAVNDLAAGAPPVTAPVATSWLQLKTTASPATICSGTPATITASFLKNSLDQSVTAGNLTALVGLPVSFTATLGTLSGAQTAIQPAGTATVMYNSNGTAGTGTVNAVVDNVPSNDATAKASLTVNVAPAFSGAGQPSAATVCATGTATFTATATGSGTITYQWYRGAAMLNNGTTAGGSMISGATTNTLSIANVSDVDKDVNYQVKATNLCNTTTSNAVALDVTQPAIAPSNTQNAAFVVSASKTLIIDANCNLIAKLEPSGAAPVSGTVAASVTIDASVNTAANGRPYVQRHFDIDPVSNPSNATATVTLFFKQSEFTAFNAFPAVGALIPTGPADAAGVANLRIFQFHGKGSGNPFSNTPATYPGTAVEINPDDNKVVYNGALNGWEVTIDVTGFSGFFAGNSGNNILPLQLVNFSGKLLQNQAQLDWATSNEKNIDYFELQRSTNAIDFNKLATINPGGNNNLNSHYSFADELGSLTKRFPAVWYRLKIMDNDGKFSYSKVIQVSLNNQAVTISVSPNPFKDHLLVNIESGRLANTSFTLVDASGSILQQQQRMIQPGSNTIRLQLPKGLAKGSYLLKVQNELTKQTLRVMKFE